MALQARTMNKQEFATLLNQTKQNPSLIDEVLTASFQQHAFDPKEHGFIAGAKTFLNSFMGKKQPEGKPTDAKIEDYFELLKTLLYGKIQWQTVVRQIQQNSQGMGVCAKVLKAGDVAWKCEDCEKDSTCIICQECFEKSNHKGHRVWLKTNVSGCCDCGDPDGWEESGFCSDHRGYGASTDAMLSSLPKDVRENSPLVFASLAKSLKGVLLDLLACPEGKLNADLMRVINQIFLFYEQCCDECPSNIYFISQSLLLIFYQNFEAKKNHKCCYRYFVNEEQRQAFEGVKSAEEAGPQGGDMEVDQVSEEFSNLDQREPEAQLEEPIPQETSQQPNQNEESKEASSTPTPVQQQQQTKNFADSIVNLLRKRNVRRCSCSVLDLICQTNNKIDRITMKLITNVFFKMFQSYDFKLNLGLAYIANLKELSAFKKRPEGILSLGVQLLTTDEITLVAMKDPVLCQEFTNTIDQKLALLIEQDQKKLNPILNILNQNSDPEHRARLTYLAYDLKYMCKLQVAPVLLSKTDFVHSLLHAVKQLHFVDSLVQPKAMEEFDATKFELITAELDLCDKIERYLLYAIKPDDIKKLLLTFLQLFESLNEQFIANKGRGFFLMPIHRIFSFFIERVLMKAYLESLPEGQNPSANQFNFYQALLHYLTPVQVQDLTSHVMSILSVHQGFMAEVKSKKWVYKGEQFQRLPLIKVDIYKEYFLTDLGLMQMMTIASQRPASAIETLMQNFGTDLWLGLLQKLLVAEQDNESKEVIPGTAGFGVKETLFEKIPRFDVLKLSAQTRQLLIQLIQMCIYETSFLQNLKNLFAFEEEKESASQAANKAKQDKIFKGHLKHVLIHYLFLFGANSTIDAIKKSIDQLYVKSDHFMETLIEVSDKTTDADGKIRFRLKEDPALLATFDPFFIAQEKHQSMQQAAYESLHKKRQCINNIVGDYENNYKYQTSINRCIKTAIANSPTAVKVIVSILKQCFEVATGGVQDIESEKAFKEKLFNPSLMYAALKLQLMISEFLTEPELLAFARRNLSTELIGKMIANVKADEKFERILMHLQKSLHPPVEGSTVEMKTETQALSQKESEEAKKAAIAKKKAAMMQKMKAKQTSFMSAKSEAMKEDKMEVDQSHHVEEELKITCAACQEACNLQDYQSKPFVQLGYSMPSKLLYHSYRQTYESQKQSLKNQKAATSGQNYSIQDPEEETKDAPKNSTDKPDTWKEEEMELVYDKLALKGVIDEVYHTGVVVSKCCHYFHHDCLLSYLTAEQAQQTYSKVHMRNTVGIDNGEIQCPFCKGMKNTWFPFLPMRPSVNPQIHRSEIDLFVTFFNQLIQSHLNNKGSNFNASRGLPQEIILVDFQKDPTKHVNYLMNIVTHLLLTLSSVRSNLLWSQYDPQVQSDDVCLRDLLVIIVSIRRLVQCLNTVPLQDLTENLLQMIQADQLCEEESFFGKNFNKTIIKLMFAICMIVDQTPQSDQLVDAVFQSVFASFKTAVAVASCFRKGYGEIKATKLTEGLTGLTQMDEEMMLSSLQFMRTATACMLLIKAVAKNCSEQQAWQQDLNVQLNPLISTFEMPNYTISDVLKPQKEDQLQCGLDIEFMNQIRQQVDDVQEFNLLAKYLKFDQSLSGLQQIPKALTDFDAALQASNASGQTAILGSGCIDSIRSAAGLDLQVDEMVADYTNQAGIKEADGVRLLMPANLLLLTPYFTFSFIDLPGDYQKLVKDYYNRKCRFCKTQVQKNAICLLCGEVLCLQMKDNCCHGQPGQLQFGDQIGDFFSNSRLIQRKYEGELCYHARVAEGGCSIFVVPSTAEIYLIDDGRVAKFDSCYRNALGETFSEFSTKKWENFFLDEKNGGTRILENLKKMYVANKVGQKVMELRLKNEMVILRHIV